MAEPLVTVCIPTWESEPFIERTLRHAAGQSHRNLRILVSIDAGRDETEAVCRRLAEDDDRIEVVGHADRLGWSRNVNFLLDQVSSEFFFLYMHDDVIADRYVELLVDRLEASPAAAAVQADVLHVLRSGRAYRTRARAREGPAMERVVYGLLDPGSPLRAMVRSERVDPSVRFAASSQRGWEAHVPFEAALFASGPFLHVPEVLYWRPSTRDGGLVAGWAELPTEEVLADQRDNAGRIVSLIRGLGAETAGTEAMIFAAYLNLTLAVRRHEIAAGIESPTPPAELAAEFDFDGVPPGVASLSPSGRRVVQAAFINLLRVESGQQLKVGRWRDALRVWRRTGFREVLQGGSLLSRRLASRVTDRFRRYDVPDSIRAWQKGEDASGG